MAELKKQAKQARKRLKNIDFDVDVDQLRKRLPDNIDWNVIRQREDEAASKGFFGGFVLGALVGVVLALIFAPQRGEETRGLVKEKATGVKDKATDLVHQVRGEAEDQRTDLSGQGPAIEREFGDRTDALLNDARSSVDQAQSRF